MSLLWFLVNWSVGRCRNGVKWSEIDVTMFPDIKFSDMSVENTLSIRVLERKIIQVEDVIWGTVKVEYIWYLKSDALWSFSFFSKSMLKLPIKTISLFFPENSFTLKVFKSKLLNSFTSMDGWQ